MIVLAAAGLVAAVSYPLVTRRVAAEGERAAITWLHTIADAQARFRIVNGGYATTLDSLVEPCGSQQPALSAVLTGQHIVDAGYEMTMRGKREAVAGPLDCHGRATSTDFYVAARPLLVQPEGSRGMAMTSGGGIFVFFDGVPPREVEMGVGGLAVPLE
jgi:Tfp pilus assembly protein PilE